MTYVLGTHSEELKRLGRQHQIWQAEAIAAWDKAGFKSGDRLLDLGCGPGFASFDLAERVGSIGQVLGIDQSANYITHLNKQAAKLQLPQLKGELLDLATPTTLLIGDGCWDGAWCRWLCMFLTDLNPLLALIKSSLRQGAKLVLHEYIRWDTFSLHPHSAAVAEFVKCCIQHWQYHGGDPNVASRLPALLQQQGFELVSSCSLLACTSNGQAKAQWLEDFLASYPLQLIASGVWTQSQQEALEAEISQAKNNQSLWQTPALVEQIWQKS